MGTILAFVSAFSAAMKAIPALISEIQKLQAFFASEAFNSFMQKIQTDTKPLEEGPTTVSQKDDAAKALASDISHL